MNDEDRIKKIGYWAGVGSVLAGGGGLWSLYEFAVALANHDQFDTGARSAQISLSILFFAILLRIYFLVKSRWQRRAVQPARYRQAT